MISISLAVMCATIWGLFMLAIGMFLGDKWAVESADSALKKLSNPDNRSYHDF